MSGTDSGDMDVEALLEHLVRLDSRNPDLAPDSPGEGVIADYVAEVLTGIGMKVTTTPVIGNRPNVVGILPGTVPGPAVVLEAHLDTVPGDVSPAAVRREGRRLYGRGTCDTKGSLAAMIAAVAKLALTDEPRPAVIIAGVMDEEFVMRGAAALIDELPEVVGVVVGEPTSLRPVRANNGFIRVYAHAHGRAAHSSKAHLGSNAIVTAARGITALDDTLGESLRHRTHPLTGPALLTATMISAGIAPNVVPDHCAVCFDRRLSPDEDPADALRAIEEVLQEVTQDDARIVLDEPIVALPGMDTPADHPLVRAAEEAVAAVLGERAPAGGVTYSTDGCHLSGRGNLPCLVYGPGSIDQAHTDDEWIDLDEVVAAVDVYAELVLRAAGLPGRAR